MLVHLWVQFTLFKKTSKNTNKNDMETKKLKNRGNNLSFKGEGDLKFKDLKFKIQNTSYLILHTSFCIQHSAFSIQNSSNCSKSNCNILWLRDDGL